MAGLENAGPGNTGADLHGWKMPDLTTRGPFSGMEKAEPDNARINRRGGKRRKFQALNLNDSRPERGRINDAAIRRNY